MLTKLIYHANKALLIMLTKSYPTLITIVSQ